jgi:hypothetical protein
MEEFSEDIIIISLAFVGIMFLILILLIISMISNALKHRKIHSWTAYTHDRCNAIKTLCQDIKSSNNRKLDDIVKLLYAQSSKIDNKFSDLNNEILLISNRLKNLETLLVISNTMLNSISNEFKQNLTTLLEKVYLSNSEWLEELLNYNVQIKKKTETLENNFVKYNSDLQQKLELFQKEQIENWNQLKYLQSFKEQVSENINVFKQIQITVSDIKKQEQQLNGMIKQHTAIAEYSKEIIESQEDIVKLLKALMLDSLTKEIDNIKK